jgi:Sulfotransferase family
VGRRKGAAGKDERYFFVHMQKTGGTSLWVRMQKHFGEHAVYPDSTDGDPHSVAPQMMIPVLLERWAARGESIRVVAGHFPLCTAELIDVPFRVLTVLRDPVERTLSYLRHLRATEPGIGDHPFEQIYEDPWWWRHFIENHMVKMLSLRTDEMESFGLMTIIDIDRERLATAKEALERIDAFGLQESLDEFARQLEARYGWDLGRLGRENTTTHVKVPDSFRRRIAEDNTLDMELYEHARDLLGR